MAKVEPLELLLPDGTTQEINWVTSPSARNLRLSMTRGGLRLSTPKYVRRGVIESFLRQQAPWIQSQLQKHGSLPTNTMLYLGKAHSIQLVDTREMAQERVAVENGILRVFPVSHSAESAIQQIERWLKTKASEHTTPLLLEFAKRMEVQVPALRFKDTASRWGSCTSHGAITLNWRLAHAPLPVMRYVVIHELAHRVHLNHSSSFWELVNRHDPDHLVHRGWLKRHGHLCRTPQVLIGKTDFHFSPSGSIPGSTLQTKEK